MSATVMYWSHQFKYLVDFVLFQLAKFLKKKLDQLDWNKNEVIKTDYKHRNIQKKKFNLII